MTWSATGLGAFVDPGDEAVAETAAVYWLRGWGGWLGWVGVAGKPADDQAVRVKDCAATRVGLGVGRVAIRVVGMDPADVFAASILEADDVEDLGARGRLRDPIDEGAADVQHGNCSLRLTVKFASSDCGARNLAAREGERGDGDACLLRVLGFVFRVLRRFGGGVFVWGILGRFGCGDGYL